MEMPIYLPKDAPVVMDEPDYLPTMLDALNALMWEFFFDHVSHRHHEPLLPVLTSQASPNER